MGTLTQYATQICDSLDRPFDEMLLSRVKDLIISERSVMIRQEFNKGDAYHYYTFPYKVDLEEIDGQDDNIIYGTQILRSVNKIPTPIRLSSPEPFIQVKSTCGTLTFVTSATEYKFRTYLGNIKDSVVYIWKNNRIYVLNNLELADLIAEAPYENPYIYMDNYNEGSIEYYADMEFPIPLDLIQNIKNRLLSGELSIIDNRDKVTPTHVDNN